MDRQELCNWTIIYTDHSKQFIHLNHLEKNNPNAQILLADTSNKFSPNFAWRNGDLLVREWLKNNYDKILYDNIAILEWDVLVNMSLPSFKVKGLIAKDKHIYHPRNRWHWFCEIGLLESYRRYAVGIAPLGVLFMNKKCIEVLLDNEFDFLYNRDIYSELRLPTILNSKSININEYEMPYVWHIPRKYHIGSGIYHPIKQQISLDVFKNRS